MWTSLMRCRALLPLARVLLIVDASQGIQAQTISNLYMAIDNNLEIIPVINKCDLESAKPDEVEDQIVDLLGCDPKRLYAPAERPVWALTMCSKPLWRECRHSGRPGDPLQALIFDSVFNPFRGLLLTLKL